ncbi:hypothetical protein QFC21_000972 [Naganishia friedmannii]|uniref:Uncharacterized protein n=1 Tax=Naganishia friedmannii TaxID=89922 RepID=A0ACC2W9J1_9TREE|nr:hypothetical protein QFC21_000972 [Naganishia friedmannii]
MDEEPVLKYRPSKPKPRRKKVSPCRCLAYTSLVFGVAIGCAIAFIIVKAVWEVFDVARHPHKAHHHKGTLEGFVQVDTDIVRPILEPDVRFDVAVALWYSLPEDEQDAMDNSTATEGEKTLMQYFNLPLRDIRPIPKQIPLFSDIIIRNASFQDEHIHRQVTYQLPLERFRAKKLGSFDVRATFVLLPLDSDRFNRISNFSDWKTDEIVVAPILPSDALPFTAQYTSPSTAEELMQSWGASLPLIRFHEIPSQCSFAPANATERHGDGSAPNLQGQNVEDWEDSTSIPTFDESLHKQHPHIVSRTHMIVVAENRPYNRTAFLKKHSDLQKKACKGPAFNLPRHYRFCQKTYGQNGEFGLKVDLDSESGTGSEIGYLPFLDVVRNAAGPKDTMPIPVNREICATYNNDTVAQRFPEDNTHINVTWNLQFSSVSAGRVSLVDHFLPPRVMESQINITERDLLIAHDAWEQHGNWPILLIIHLLEVVYWYSRTSIGGLDLWATGFLAAHIVLESICPLVYDKDQDYQKSGAATRFLILVITAWAAIPTILIVKLMSPLEITWSTWAKMEIHRSRLNRQERASQRIASQISPSIHLMTVAALAIACYLISYFHLNRDLIAPLVAHEHYVRGVTERILFNLDFGFKVSASLFQIIMNRKCSTFAGRYRISAILSSLAMLLWVARLSQRFIGKRNPAYSFDAMDGFNAVIELYTAYQAITLPSVKQDTVDEDEE